MCCIISQGGWTALHSASSRGHVEVVNMLLMKDFTLIKQTDNVSNHAIHYDISSHLKH